MKALSIRQPWGWAILHGGKRVENRPWSTSFRGEFLIHVGLSCPDRQYTDAVAWMVARAFVSTTDVEGGRASPFPIVPELAALPRGGIVGRARIVDVLAPAATGTPRAPWHIPNQFGFVLEDVVPLPFAELKGCTGWFDVDVRRSEEEAGVADAYTLAGAAARLQAPRGGGAQ